MTAVIEGSFGVSFPADPAEFLRLLCVLPVRNTFAELLVVLPPAYICVATGGLDVSPSAVLLVVDPVTIVSVAVLEGV